MDGITRWWRRYDLLVIGWLAFTVMMSLAATLEQASTCSCVCMEVSDAH